MIAHFLYSFLYEALVPIIEVLLQNLIKILNIRTKKSITFQKYSSLRSLNIYVDKLPYELSFGQVTYRRQYLNHEVGDISRSLENR